MMAAKDSTEYVTLATRIPKELHRQLHSVETGMSQMEFVCAALQEKLRTSGAQRARDSRRRPA
jgi:hypothetical protein